MKIINKVAQNGHIKWYLCGIKVLSYADARGRISDFGEHNKLIDIPESVSVCVYGHGNCVHFMDRDASFIGELHIGTIDCPVRDALIEIDHGVTSNGVMIRVMEDATVVKIGRGSMISSGVQIWASDTHAMVSTDGALLNRGEKVEIGDNVWICNGVTILKNTVIPSGCVVGAQAVVSGRWTEENSVLAGNPAVVCKRGIRWLRDRPNRHAEP